MRMFTLRSMAAGWTIGRSADLLRFFFSSSQLFHPKTRELTLPARCDANGNRWLSPASPDDDLVALPPVQIQVRLFYLAPCNVQHATEGGQRTCRPLDRGQNSTKCTSLRRALGIVGDSCQEHGESMQGEEVSPVRSHPSHRTGAARRRQEPSRPASCHLNAPSAFSHVCRCPQRNRRGGGRVNSVGPGGRRKKGTKKREQNDGEHVLEFFFKRIPNIAPCRSVKSWPAIETILFSPPSSQDARVCCRGESRRGALSIMVAIW